MFKVYLYICLGQFAFGFIVAIFMSMYLGSVEEAMFYLQRVVEQLQ